MHNPSQTEIDEAEIALSVCYAKLSTAHPIAALSAMTKFSTDFEQLRSDNLLRLDDDQRQEYSTA